MKNIFQKITTLILLIIIALVVVLLIFNDLLVYGIVVGAVALVAYVLYVGFIRAKALEIADLRDRLATDEAALEKVKQENEELRHRKLNLSAIRQILDVGLFEIDTNFTRTWNEELITDEGKNIQFIGALRVDVKARYGVDLTELRIKQTPTDVYIANMHLKSLSFNDLNYDWVISEVLELKKPYLGGSHRRTDAFLQLEAQKIKDRLQKRIHEEVKQGPEELNTVIEILKKQLSHSIAALLGLRDKNVHFVDKAEPDFQQLDSINLLN